MTAIVDTTFSRVGKESIIRSPLSVGALTGNDIAYSSTLTLNEKISTITGEDLTASSVETIPSGNLAATNVQDALDELQSDIDTKGVGNMLKSDNLSGLANYTTARSNLGLGSLATQSGTFSGTSSGTNTGDQISIVGITGTKVQFNAAVTDGDLLYVGDVTSNATHTGDVTGATALTIANSAVTNAKMANMATKTYKGRTSAATGVPEDVPVATLKSDLILVKGDVGLGNVDNTSDATKNSATVTLTNKRNQPRIVSAASYTTDTGTSLDVSTCDIFIITAQAGALLFNAPSGTPVQGEKLIIRIKDNGTARALTWNAIFRAMGTALPTTTVLSKTLYLGFIYSATDTKWDLIASAQEA